MDIRRILNTDKIVREKRLDTLPKRLWDLHSRIPLCGASPTNYICVPELDQKVLDGVSDSKTDAYEEVLDMIEEQFTEYSERSKDFNVECPFCGVDASKGCVTSGGNSRMWHKKRRKARKVAREELHEYYYEVFTDLIEMLRAACGSAITEFKRDHPKKAKEHDPDEFNIVRLDDKGYPEGIENWF